MKSWHYGTNAHFRTASVYLMEGPWWAFSLAWLADNSCALIPDWHLPILKQKRLVVDGEATTFGEYYGTLKDMYHMRVCLRLFQFAHARFTTKVVPMKWQQGKDLFYTRDQAFWDADLADALAQMPTDSAYTLWIEAEHWPPEEWDPADANTDVVVTDADGERWVATFVTYQNLLSLRAKHGLTGECLSGKYQWISDLILVDQVTRERLEQVIQDLIATGAFSDAFRRLPNR